MKKGKAGKWFIIGLGAFLIIGSALPWEWSQPLKNPVTFKSGAFSGVVLLTAYWVGLMTWNAVKGQTNALFSQNQRFGWNPNDGVEPAGPFSLMRIGGINVPKFWISTPGGEGTVIAPMDGVTPIGANVLVKAITRRVPFTQLPPEVKDVIRAKHFVPPYYVGVAPYAVETRGGDYLREHRKTVLDAKHWHHAEELVARSSRVGDHAGRYMAAKVDELGQGKVVSGWKKIFSSQSETKDPDRQYNDEEQR